VSSKKRILKTNSLTSNFQSKPSAISAQVSISPYWNGRVAEWSQKLWLPTVINYTSLPSTSSSMCSSSILQNSGFLQLQQAQTFPG
jgi:hypothetical protein